MPRTGNSNGPTLNAQADDCSDALHRLTLALFARPADESFETACHEPLLILQQASGARDALIFRLSAPDAPLHPVASTSILPPPPSPAIPDLSPDRPLILDAAYAPLLDALAAPSALMLAVPPCSDGTAGLGLALCLTAVSPEAARDLDTDFVHSAASLLGAAMEKADHARLLADRVARLQSLVDSMPVLVFAENDTGATSYWNAECERVTGFSAEEIVDAGDVHEKLYPNVEYRRELLRARRQRGAGYRYWEWDIATRGGSTKRISWSSLKATPPSDEIVSWQVGVDLTERLQVQEMVIRAKQEWERTFDSVPDFILILDLSMAVRRLNMAAAQKLGRHPREIVGAPLAELLGAGETMDRIRFMAHSDSSQTEELDLPALNGHYLVTLAPYTLATDHRIGSIFIARDISRRRALEEQLHQSQKMEALGTLAGGIAHDFNTVIGVICGYAEMLLESEDDDSPRARMLRKILQSGDRAQSLVSQVLTFSRQTPTQTVELQLASLIEENLKLVEAITPANITVTTHFYADSDLASADPVLVGQIVMNLCTNAFHSMRNGGRLEVSLEKCFLDGSEDTGLPPDLAALPPGFYLRLGVRDTGHGMTQEVQERLFDPFYTTKKPGEGTGMGMAVVHGVARRLDGAVLVDSAPGSGTAIGVFLPEKQTLRATPGIGGAGHDIAPTATNRSVPDTDDTPGGSEYILLVSQDHDIAPAERDILEGLGYTVTLADSREDALEWTGIPDNRCDLMITDMTLARGDGLELAEMVADRRAARLPANSPGLPVILCTTPSQIVSFARAHEAGVRFVLSKPLFLNKLARAIRSVLDGS